MTLESWIVLWIIAKAIGVVLMALTLVMLIGVFVKMLTPKPKQSTPLERWIKGG
jgi:hypothetical protein